MCSICRRKVDGGEEEKLFYWLGLRRRKKKCVRFAKTVDIISLSGSHYTRGLGSATTEEKEGEELEEVP